MSRNKDGGQAFPTPETDHQSRRDGMTLRDFFAAAAMLAEFLSVASFKGPAAALVEAASRAGQSVPERIAFNAYKIADAMIAEREK